MEVAKNGDLWIRWM